MNVVKVGVTEGDGRNRVRWRKVTSKVRRRRNRRIKLLLGLTTAFDS